MKTIKSFFILSLFFFISCIRNNDKIDMKFEKQFSDSISKLNGDSREIWIAPDWKAKVSYKNGKPRLIFAETMPEFGYIKYRIFINENNIIEKIIIRKNLPNYNSNQSSLSEDYKLQDFLYVVNPKNKELIEYRGNKINKIKADINFVEDVMLNANYYKTQAEEFFKNPKPNINNYTK